MNLTRDQLSILQHSIGADQFGRQPQGSSRNHFVTEPTSDDGRVCESLVILGLMVSCGSQGELTGGMTLYRATQLGIEAVSQFSPKPPKLTRSQRRYRDWLHADPGVSFAEWAGFRKGRREGGAA